MDLATLLLFCSTFFLVSQNPGMCMQLALSLGMSMGLKRTLPMMFGELLGVATVSVAAVMGVSSLMLGAPGLFAGLKLVGGAYLIYLGVQMWRSKGQLSDGDEVQDVTARGLFLRGWLTAIANPKGWAFMVALLPPFIDAERPLVPQLAMLIGIILVSEFTAMTLYATGGSTLRRLLQKDNVKLMNRVAGSLMAAIGVWLMVE